MNYRLPTICGLGLGSGLVLGAIAATAAPLPQTWVRIYTDEYDTIAYVDRASIQGSKRFRYFWAYVKAGTPFPDPESAQMVSQTAAYISTDCQQNKYRIRAVKFLNSQRQVVREMKYGSAGPTGMAGFHPAAVGSIRFVCNYQMPPQPQSDKK